jgi:hypothetical protein
MKKKQAESNPNPVLRREALASDVERFLQSGNKIEQIPSGVSAQANLNPAKLRPAPGTVKESTETTEAKTEEVSAETSDAQPSPATEAAAEAKTDPDTATNP